MSKEKNVQCEGINCKGGECGRCGFNPREIARRKRMIKAKGLTKDGDTSRLIITGRKKK